MLNTSHIYAHLKVYEHLKIHLFDRNRENKMIIEIIKFRRCHITRILKSQKFYQRVQLIRVPFCSVSLNQKSSPFAGLETKISERLPFGRVAFKLHSPR